MSSGQLRQKFLDFYRQRGHTIIPSSPLVPENDPSTLFTSSGMQPLIPYLLGQIHPSGKRLVNSQKSFRLQDIDDVGDNRHTTFFEMLGNWSLGDYFKSEQIPWFYEFLTKDVGLPSEKLYVSVFAGDDQVSRDDESKKIWSSLGVPEGHIFSYDVKKNWWARNGAVPDTMPIGEPGGPDSEVFYDFGSELKLHENSPWKDETCHPNCDCGRFLEIGNSVFMQYQKTGDGTLRELPQQNVDFGGGLERTLAAALNTPDVFCTDLFLPIVHTIEKASGKSYSDPIHQPSFRIIADHIKAAVMLIADSVVPSNKAQGYMLRRLIRRAVVKMRKMTDTSLVQFSREIALAAGGIYKDVYLSEEQVKSSAEIISTEVEKFTRVLERGLKEISQYPKLDAKIAFNLLQTYGFPWELTYEIATESGQHLDIKEFEIEFNRHQQLSRTASQGMFKGGLQDHSEVTTKYHTATHLLHKALRGILGSHVQQRGSNITSERLRFDFSHDSKLSPDQIIQVEQVVNGAISANLPVTRQEIAKATALKEGALAFFPEKYPEIASVYTIGPQDDFFSKELCGGPHVSSTGEIGRIKIIKEESAGSGIRRIYAALVTESL